MLQSIVVAVSGALEAVIGIYGGAAERGARHVRRFFGISRSGGKATVKGIRAGITARLGRRGYGSARVAATS